VDGKNIGEIMCGLFKKWKDWWNGDDENSILKQIRDMMWYAGIFEILKQVHNVSQVYDVSKVYNISQENNVSLSNNRNARLPNSVFWEFIYFSHFEIQTNAIMRLLDKRKNKDVLSLRRLLEDIKENRLCLTRQNILESLDLPYEYKNGLIANPGTEEFKKCFHAQQMHQNIDRLAGISDENQRKPSDTIRECVIDWILNQLKADELKNIETYRHKYVAHSATEESRNGKNLKDMEIKLSKLSKANEIICKTASFVSENILGDGQKSFLAADVRGVSDNLGHTFISQKKLCDVVNDFDRYSKQVEKWCNWDWSSEFKK
jgi:hypothetical protein